MKTGWVGTGILRLMPNDSGVMATTEHDGRVILNKREGVPVEVS